MDTFHPSIREALERREEAQPRDFLREILLEEARLSNIEPSLAESLFETALVLYRPDRRILAPAVRSLAQSIDHTSLTITPADRFTDARNVLRLCREAGEWGMASVCVRPNKVSLASHLLTRWGIKDVAVCTVIDFPHERGGCGGQADPMDKAVEAIAAQENGAQEFDVVIDYDALLEGDTDRITHGMYAVADAVKSRDPGAIVKAILETAFLRRHGGESAIRLAAEAAMDGGADYLKTSTGYALEGGATPEDVRLLYELAEPRGVLVKASGGIATLPDALKFRSFGASRLGIGSGSLPIIRAALLASEASPQQ